MSQGLTRCESFFSGACSPGAAFSALVVLALAALRAEDSRSPAERIAGLLPALSSREAGEVERASRELEALCLHAGRPGADGEREAVSRALVEKLGPDFPVATRVLLVEALAKVGRAEATAALGKLVRPGVDPVLADAARRALEAIPHPSAKSELRKALSTVEGALKIGVINSLGARRDSIAAPDLMDAAGDQDLEVRLAALSSLARIGDVSAVPLVEAALTELDGLALSRLQAIYLDLADSLVTNDERGAARRIYDKAMGLGPVLRARALVGFARAGLQKEADRIVDCLDDPDPRVRGAALDAAAMMAAPSIVPGVLAKLDAARDDDQRIQLLEVLAKRQEKEALARVLAAARDEKGAVRAAAIRGCLRFADRLPDDKQADARGLYETILSLGVDDATSAQCVRGLRRLGVQVDLAHPAGFVTAWWILGPLPNPGGALWDKALGPESGVDLTKGLEWNGKTYGWAFYHSPNRRGLVELHEIDGFAMDNCAAYLYAEATFPEAHEALFKVGSGDQAAFWLNGRQVYANKMSRGLGPDQDTVEVALEKGPNRILVKVFTDGGPWGACLRITDRSGSPLHFEQKKGSEP